MTVYVVITGGVISGIGKGVIASSTGLLLKTLGLKVTAIKIDPYLNIDAGTMAPTEHGEVYVLDDGGEADLDLGNYERYLDVTLTRDNNITTGKIYREVIERERKGDYLGKTVQVIPHITDAIQDWIEKVSKLPVDDTGEEPDVCIIELGGTLGDIESMPFVEALRQFQFRVGKENFALIHVSLVPVIHGEQKTKPTQTSVKDVRGLGLFPDLIACRCETPLHMATAKKIAMFCHVAEDQVLAVRDVSSVYHVPLLLKEQGLLKFLHNRLNLDHITIPTNLHRKGLDLERRWKDLTLRRERLYDKTTIVLVGKYVSLKDSYMSVIKSLEHASMQCGRKLSLQWVDSSNLEDEAKQTRPREFHGAWQALCSADGVLVPGGFGSRGTEGMMMAAKWARENKVPFLGICLGFQVAVLEYMRNVMGLNARSTEFVEDAEVAGIVFMPEISKTHMGGTMRLGLRATHFQANTDWSVVKKLYGGEEVIWERHRHRYEVNPSKVSDIEAAGLIFSGRDDTGERMQVAEIRDHPFYVGMQSHPEFSTRPLVPSPPYLGLLAAACGQLQEVCAAQKELVKSNHKLRHPSPISTPRPGSPMVNNVTISK